MASTNEALRGVERALRITYPASFHARILELEALAATPAFERAFAATRLLLDAGEVRKVREASEPGLLPFMFTSAPHPDIYAFEPDATGPEPRVIVWSVHTAVHAWPDFSAFLAWVRKLCAAKP